MMVVLGECYARQYGIRTVNFLVPNMYGPYDSVNPDKAHALNALVAKIVKVTKEGCERLDVWGTGTAIREWLYAADFARFAVEAMERLDEDAFAEPLNVAQNRGHSVKDIVQIITEEAGFTGEIDWDRDKPDGAPCKVMDDARFRSVFPDFAFIDLRTGVRQTMEYYQSVYPY